MTLLDVLIIALGLLLGYWAVSTFLFPNSPKRPAVRRPPPPSAPVRRRWSDVLLVPPSASTAEIREAYRRLISQYHPDKVNNMGQELRDVATAKSQQITSAYVEALRERGEQR